MAAGSVSIPSSSAFSTVRRRNLSLTERRLAANRRNARRSTGPRTIEGKAKVARNPIKHGFFVAQEKWNPTQCREFEELSDGLREEFAPQSPLEEGCVATIAASYVRMAALLRWENIAALKYHQQCEREMNERIAAAEPAEASRLETHRESLRRAGLWRPTLPGPRETNTIIRYSGRLDRTIRQALHELEGLKGVRFGSSIRSSKAQKQTHFEPSARSALKSGEGPRISLLDEGEMKKQSHSEPLPRKSENAKANPFGGSADTCPEALRRASNDTDPRNESEKANPLSSMFMGNRHERRRAKALARKHT